MSETSKTNSIVTVGNILRQGVAGGVFVLSYCYSRAPHNPIEQLRMINRAYLVVLVLTLLFGILIYSFHRACANPLIELLVQALWRQHNNWWKWFKRYVIPEEILRLMWRRWLYLSASKDIHTHVTDWGDYVHLQYCTSWAIALGSLSAWLTSADDDWMVNWLLVFLVVVCFVFGLFSDLRKKAMEQWLYRMNDELQKQLNDNKSPNACSEIELAQKTKFLP